MHIYLQFWELLQDIILGIIQLISHFIHGMFNF